MPFQSHPNFGFPLSDFFHSTEEPNSCVLHHNNQQNSDTAWTLHSVVPVWMHSSIQSAAHQWFMLFVCCCSHIGHSLPHKQFILSPVFQHSSRDHTAAMEANKQTCCCTPLFVEMFLFFLGEMNKKHIHVSHCSHVSQHEGHKESLQQCKTAWTNWSGMTSFVSFLWQHKTVICSSICNAAERINRRVGCLSKQEEKMNSNWTTWQCIQAVPGHTTSILCTRSMDFPRVGQGSNKTASKIPCMGRSNQSKQTKIGKACRRPKHCWQHITGHVPFDHDQESQHPLSS